MQNKFIHAGYYKQLPISKVWLHTEFCKMGSKSKSSYFMFHSSIIIMTMTIIQGKAKPLKLNQGARELYKHVT